MKFYRIFILFGSLLVFTRNVRAESPLCRDPVKSVCETRKNTEVKRIVDFVSDLAANQVIQYFQISKGNQIDFRKSVGFVLRSSSDEEYPETKISKWSVFYFSCLDYLARSYLENPARASSIRCFKGKEAESLSRISNLNGFSGIGKMLRVAKFSVLKAVDQNYLHFGFKRIIEDEMKSTTFLTAGDFLLRGLGPSPEQEKYGLNLFDFISLCDFRQTSENAATLPLFRTASILRNEVDHQILICPSVWLSALAKSPQFKNSFISSPFLELETITHELSHLVEQAIRGTLYENVHQSFDLLFEAHRAFGSAIECLDRRYVKTHRLFIQAIDPEYESRLDFNPHAQVADLFFSEISADELSAQAFGIFLKTLTNRSDREALASLNLNDHCDSAEHERLSTGKLLENNLHPSGTFRINNNFFGISSFRQSLGCSLTNIHAPCLAF